jgi:nucleoid-associated protein YgaU
VTDALKQLEALLQGAGAGTQTFPPNSRYFGIETAVSTRADGQAVAYLRRRLVPAAERFAAVAEHTVTDGDRLDLIASRYLGDPELQWRICDANGAFRPKELVEEAGSTLRITLPEGSPGTDDA